jgi:hypothetical protein
MIKGDRNLGGMDFSMAPPPRHPGRTFVDCQVEEPCDSESQRQRRQVAAVLDRDHGLPGHAQGGSQLSLGEPLLIRPATPAVPRTVDTGHSVWRAGQRGAPTGWRSAVADRVAEAFEVHDEGVRRDADRHDEAGDGRQ